MIISRTKKVSSGYVVMWTSCGRPGPHAPDFPTPPPSQHSSPYAPPPPQPHLVHDSDASGEGVRAAPLSHPGKDPIAQKHTQTQHTSGWGWGVDRVGWIRRAEGKVRRGGENQSVG